MKIIFISLIYFATFLNGETLITDSCINPYKTTSYKLNVRQAPNKKSKILKVLQKNTQICIIDFKDDWAKINLGWLSQKYIIPINKSDAIQKINDKNKKSSNPISNKSIFVIIILFILLLFLLRGIYLIIRDKHYFEFFILFVLICILLIRGEFENIYILIPIGLIILYVLNLPKCENCGNSKLTLTEEVSLGNEIKVQRVSGNKDKLNEIESIIKSYYCPKCNHTTVIMEKNSKEINL